MGLLMPALTILLVGGLLASGVVHNLGGEGGERTYAIGVASSDAQAAVTCIEPDIKLNGEDHISGTLVHESIAPGDSQSATIDITGNRGDLSGCVMDAALDIEGDQTPFTEFLYLSILRYGADDLLSAPGRDLIEEIDGNPNCGNQDARLSVNELMGCTVQGLPNPTPAGKEWEMEVTFATDHADFGAADNDLQGKNSDLTFIFYYRDELQEPYP